MNGIGIGLSHARRRHPPATASDRTAAALAARGHDVREVPLMQVEPVAADLSGSWGAVVITSANAPAAIADNPARDALLELPVFAVGRRSAEAAREAGFADVTSAGGDVRDLVRLLPSAAPMPRRPCSILPARTAPPIWSASLPATASRPRCAWSTAPSPRRFRDELIAALEAGGDVQAVLHFSRRSAENYVAGAREAGVAEQALDVRHYCLSAQVAAPLRAAGAKRVAVAPRPEEAALIALLPLSPG